MSCTFIFYDTMKKIRALKKIQEKLFLLIRRYNKCFATKTGNCSKKASEYLRGLIQSNKCNITAMAEVIPETNSQSLQHFISYSPFDEDVNNKLGGEESALLIDDSDTPKAGKSSAG